VNVLALHSRYRSGPASGENALVADEARLLQEAGHDVHVFEASVSGRLDTLHGGPEVIWDLGRAAAVRQPIRRYRPDVVHVHNLAGYGLVVNALWALGCGVWGRRVMGSCPPYPVRDGGLARASGGLLDSRSPM
jgi:hypothetical protein